MIFTYDRWMRTERELSETIPYVEENPVRRGLIGSSADWRWSSAFTGGKTAGVTG